MSWKVWGNGGDFFPWPEKFGETEVIFFFWPGKFGKTEVTFFPVQERLTLLVFQGTC